MADRLTKITTRGGDKGETSLGDGNRVSKCHPQIGLLGIIDELNSSIGVVLAHDPGSEVAAILQNIQHDLFDLGGALCFPGMPLLSQNHVARLDEAGERLNADLKPLKEFVLPGGSPLIAVMHVARTTARRCERELITAQKNAKDNDYAVAYLNRLSDILFIAGRYEAKRTGVKEILWEKEKSLFS